MTVIQNLDYNIYNVNASFACIILLKLYSTQP